MRRYLKFAVILGVANAVGTTIAVLLFRRLDLRFSTFLELLLIPALQASVLIWLAPSSDAGRWRAMFREFITNRFLFPAFALDVAFFGIAVIEKLTVLWLLHGAVAAAMLFVAASRVRVSRPDVAWLWAFGGGVVLYALSYSTPWLADLPSLFGKGRTVIRWTAAYAPLFVIAILAMVKVDAVFDRIAPVAARFIDVSIACALLAALLVVSNIFFHPFLVEPWRSIEQLSSWLVITGLILAPLSALAPREASNEAA